MEFTDERTQLLFSADPSKSVPNLSGKMLLATSMCNNSEFERAIIYLCVHDLNGSVGIIVNRPSGRFINHSTMFEEDEFVASKSEKKYAVLNGGPVNKEHLFAILGKKRMSSIIFYKNIQEVTAATRLKEINFSKDKLRIVSGICTWLPGQLDSEINSSVWFIVPADFDTIFSQKTHRTKWDKEMTRLGISNTDSSILPFVGNA